MPPLKEINFLGVRVLGILSVLLSTSGKTAYFCPFFNEGWEGPNIFSYNNEILFKTKRILYGNEWDNDKNKQIIKIPSQNISPGPEILSIL